LVTLISTYKTILHFYAVIITDLIQRTAMSRLHMLNSVNGGQGFPLLMCGEMQLM